MGEPFLASGLSVEIKDQSPATMICAVSPGGGHKWTAEVLVGAKIGGL